MREQERGVKIVEDGEVDLAGAASGGIDDEGGGDAVAGGKIPLKQTILLNKPHNGLAPVRPLLFRSRAAGRGVLKEAAEAELGEHFVLHAAENLSEVELAGIGMAGHGSMGGFRFLCFRLQSRGKGARRRSR